MVAPAADARDGSASRVAVTTRLTTLRSSSRNCKLYAWPVYAIVEHGVRSAEGIEHRVDVIIVGEGVEIAGLPTTRKERIAA